MKTIGRALLFLFCVFLFLPSSSAWKADSDNPPDCDC